MDVDGPMFKCKYAFEKETTQKLMERPQTVH